MALVTKTSVATGKASATGTWSDAVKPKEGENTFLIVTGGFSVEYNLAVKITGMEVTSTGILTGTETAAKLGTAEGGPSGVMLKIASAATITWTGNVEISSTFTSSSQTIEVVNHSLKRISALTSNKAKIKLIAALTVTEKVLFDVSATTTSTLELNGQTLTTPLLEMREKTTLDGTGGTVRVTSAEGGAVFSANASGVVATGWGTMTIEAAEAGETNVKKIALPAAVTLGTLVVAERNVEVEGEGVTISTLTVNNKGAAVGKGLKFKAGQKFAVGTWAGNGTEAEPARVESSEAGVAAKVKVSEQEVTSWVAFQDLTIETGIVYFLHGTSVSGNTTEGTTFKLEAKPAGGVTVAQGMLI